MDIVRVVKAFHLKASFETLKLKHKFFLLLFLISLVTNLVPHLAQAAISPSSNNGPALVFNVGSNDYQDYLTQLAEEASDKYYQQQLEDNVQKQLSLTEKVQTYLEDQGSPLAQYASTLVTLRNWKKIVALSNAESSMCRNYPVDKSNCWGVGGSNLWDMGNDLNEGVVSMNEFLNNYPKGSALKYSEMSFADMNGIYKQPAAQHWVDNAQRVYQDLSQIELSIAQS